MSNKDTVLQRLFTLRAGLSYISQLKDSTIKLNANAKALDVKLGELDALQSERKRRMEECDRNIAEYKSDDTDRQETALIRDTDKLESQYSAELEKESAELQPYRDRLAAIESALNKTTAAELSTEDAVYELYDNGVFGFLCNEDIPYPVKKDLSEIAARTAKITGRDIYSNNVTGALSAADEKSKKQYDGANREIQKLSEKLKSIRIEYSAKLREFDRAEKACRQKYSSGSSFSFKQLDKRDSELKKIRENKNAFERNKPDFKGYGKLENKLKELELERSILAEKAYGSRLWLKAISNNTADALSCVRDEAAKKVYTPESQAKLDNVRKRREDGLRSLKDRRIENGLRLTETQAELKDLAKKSEQGKTAIAELKREIEDKRNGIAMLAAEAQNLRNLLAKENMDLLVPEQWENLDIVIYYIYNGLAHDTVEALQQKAAEDRHNELLNTVRKMEADLIQTVNNGFNGMRDIMVQGFTLMSHQLSAIQEQQFRNNLEMLRLHDTVADIKGDLDFSNALLQKTSASCSQLVSDAGYMCSLASSAEVRRRNGL